jgi:6,7-dimethyl-8-ribityllumazine synthase
MVRKLEGDLLAGDLKIAVAISRFNDFITAKLLEGAVDVMVRHGGNEANLTVAYVPGSAELPVAAMKLAASGKYAAVVCLGCVIRGATDHYEHVTQLTVRGIGEVGVKTGVPTIFGVITADNLEQAIERAGSKQGNQGAKAMLAAIEMANLLRKMSP